MAVIGLIRIQQPVDYGIVKIISPGLKIRAFIPGESQPFHGL